VSQLDDTTLDGPQLDFLSQGDIMERNQCYAKLLVIAVAANIVFGLPISVLFELNCCAVYSLLEGRRFFEVSRIISMV
jgi:hypothetical protein